MSVYYNEFDPKAAAWLRQLIDNGNIAPGYVDERSILDVKPEDLEGYTQHHFFAGIGVWSYALRNAGWSDETPVCTASLPCQPFSIAGQQKGKDDERHLLPHFMQLVKQCGFDTIFGEQVESAIRHGWLDDLQATMEREGYAVGHCVLGAHSVNAAHQRQRLYWVAGRLAHSKSNGNIGRLRQISEENEKQQTPKEQRKNQAEQPNDGSKYSRMGNTKHDGHVTSEKRPSDVQPSSKRRQEEQNLSWQLEGTGGRENTESLSGRESGCSERDNSIEWIYCRDGKYRPIKSSIKPLVNGLARGVVYSGGAIDPNNTAFARAIRLKGYGNAINADVAELFISTFMEVTDAEEQ
jgi:DNA (cytosine-5)-methyltransferase 1